MYIYAGYFGVSSWDAKGRRQIEGRLKGRYCTADQTVNLLFLLLLSSKCVVVELLHRQVNTHYGWMDKHPPRHCAVLINSALWNWEQIMWLPTDFLREPFRIWPLLGRLWIHWHSLKGSVLSTTWAKISEQRLHRGEPLRCDRVNAAVWGCKCVVQ